MRKQSFPLIVGTGLLCVFFGWLYDRINFTALAQNTLPAKSQDTSIDQKVAEAAFVTSAIDYLDSGRPQDAAHLLRLRQGADILVIDDLLSSASERSRRTATELFRRIAGSHPNWKADYRGDLPQADTNAAARVESILKRYR